MKTVTPRILAVFAISLLSACDKPQSKPVAPAPESKPAATAPPVAAMNADADRLMQVILSAEPEEKSRAGKAVQAMRAENYAAALDIFELLLKEGHLSPEQTELVNRLMTKLRDLSQPKP